MILWLLYMSDFFPLDLIIGSFCCNDLMWSWLKKNTNFSSQQQWRVNKITKQQPWDIAFLFTNKQVAGCEEMFTEYYIYV